MRAALITGANQIELVDFPEPAPAPTGVVVDVAYCGICGTDIQAFRSGRPYNPAICGHEWTGTVSAVGAEVRMFSEGDRVVVAVPPACGRCAACVAGHRAHCMTAHAVALGRDALAPPHGGFAPRLAIGQGRVVLANPALTDEQLAQVEPATIALHAVRRSSLRSGDLAVVQGAGPVGLLTLQCVKSAGAGHLIVIEPDERRRAIAAAMGATAVVSPDHATELVMEQSNGLGADIVYECVGRPETIQAGVDLARRGGSVCLIGVANEVATINPSSWVVKEISLSSSLAYVHEEFEMAMGMMADGEIEPQRLHTASVGLDDLAATFRELAAGTTDDIKILVDPNLPA